MCLGSHNVADLDPVWFRHHIGVVSQEPVLFACSISDNISFGREDATHKEIVEAAKQANAHDFVSSFDVSMCSKHFYQHFINALAASPFTFYTCTMDNL